MIAKPTLMDSIKLPLAFVGLWWVIQLMQYVFELEFGYLGIYPLSLSGLKGIFIAPMIHGDFSHLIHNSIPFLVLSTMILFFYRSVALRSFIMIYLLTGIAVWVGARSVFHIGASGVVYGLMTFVLGNGLFRRNIKSIVLALSVFIFYSGMLVGVLPNQEGISWESHLFGALVGLFVAFFYKEEIEEDELDEEIIEDDIADADRPFFLERDVFEMTREERRLAAEAEAQRLRDQQTGWTSSGSWDVD